MMRNKIKAQRRQYGLRLRVTSTIHAAMGDTLIKVAIEISNTDEIFKLWDKAQVIVACSRTKIGKNTIFVGDKKSTIDLLVTLIQQKNHWTDYMEKVLELVSIQRENDINDNANTYRGILDIEPVFPFRLCDMTIPDCKTGFVYFLVSMREPSYSYIGMTDDIERRLAQHNRGGGSSQTSPAHLRPFALFAVICGFDCNRDLMREVEFTWQRNRNRLKSNGIRCQKEWARRAGQLTIDHFNNNQNVVSSHDLRLILLFRDHEFDESDNEHENEREDESDSET